MSPLRRELKQSRAFSTQEQETYLNLQRSAGVIAGPFDRLFKSHALSQPLYNVLRILQGHATNENKSPGMPCSHIGERMVTRVPDITRLVDKLIRMDLAQRERSLADRRVVLISITAKGTEAVADLVQPVTALENQSLGHLSAREMTELNRLLAKVRKSD